MIVVIYNQRKKKNPEIAAGFEQSMFECRILPNKIRDIWRNWNIRLEEQN